jgi:DNA-binding response OmpR family regulator
MHVSEYRGVVVRIVLIEDDRRLRVALEVGLRRHGFDVVGVGTAAAALRQLIDEPEPEAVLLDLGLPDRDGFELCEFIRRRSEVPIVVISARGQVEARVRGLGLGADDYLVKPFHLAELIARLEAVTRRTLRTRTGAAPRTAVAEVRTVGRLHIDAAAQAVTVDGDSKALTSKEFELLETLADRPGAVLPRQEIVDRVWPDGGEGAGRTLEVHIASLRAKLGKRSLIQTVRRVGYRLTAD